MQFILQETNWYDILPPPSGHKTKIKSSGLPSTCLYKIIFKTSGDILILKY